MIWLMLVYVDVLFPCGECGFNSLGSWSYSKEWVWNLGTKSMLHCFREMKCQLGDTPEFNIGKTLLQDNHSNRMSVAYWLAQQDLIADIRVCFPGGQNIYLLLHSDIVNFLLKTNDEGDRRPNLLLMLFGVLAVLRLKLWSVRDNVIIQMAHYSSHVFSLIHILPLDEFSFKKMRTWGQSKISSCCLCVWCKSRELGSRGSPRFVTPIVESFSLQTFYQL